MKCKRTKRDGTRCQANAMQSNQFCFRHDDKSKDEALKASAAGGEAKRQFLNLGKPMVLRTPADIKILMAKSINKLWVGEMPSSNPAGALGYLAKIFLEAYEKSELEIRVGQLEKRIDQLNV